MKRTIVFLGVLMLLAPAVRAGQDWRWETYRERAEIRRQVREAARERYRDDRYRGDRYRDDRFWRGFSRDAYRREYRQAAREAQLEARHAAREARWAARDAAREVRRALRDAWWR